MRLVLVVSGGGSGGAGLPPRTVVEARPGSSQEAELRALVERAEIARFPEPTMRTGDRTRYTLIVEDGETQHSVLFDEEQTPARFRPLIEAILREGRPEEGDGPSGRV